jgi:peroxiredoxin
MKLKYILYLVLLISLSASGQNIQIKIELQPAAEKEIILANHYLENIYANDTIKLDSKGRGVFERDSLLPQGLYKIYMDQDHHFDFLLGSDQGFLLKNDSFNTHTMQIKGSAETEGFVDYTLFVKNLRERKSVLQKTIATAKREEKGKLIKELYSLDSELHNYWDKIDEELPNSFLSKFVKANYLPSLDVSSLTPEVKNNDSLLLRARYYYQRSHYWDYFDYTDERFLYTPFYKQKLERWFTKVLYQSYDSVKTYVLDFIEEVKPDKRIFQFVTSFFLNSSINSKIMGMDALFVDIAKKYYLSGEAFWASGESLEKIKENVLFTENNLISMTAPDLTLESVDGQLCNLHRINASFTLVVLYEPDCSHCNVFVPGLYTDVYQQYRNKGLEVYAIYTMDNKEKWKEFIGEYGLKDWINVWDSHHVSGLRILYDARTTPGVYLLDENKKIVAKKMSVEQIKKILEHELK